jgi:hypothetical protein
MVGLGWLGQLDPFGLVRFGLVGFCPADRGAQRDPAYLHVTPASVCGDQGREA